MLENNLIAELAKTFALRIISLAQYLLEEHKYDFVLQVLVKQVTRSGTSIGANIFESKNAQSRADFINKLNIALKEADETKYWLTLLHESRYLSDKEFVSIVNDNNIIIGILVRIIKTTRKNEKMKNGKNEKSKDERNEEDEK
jgi:four helix bundle protein